MSRSQLAPSSPLQALLWKDFQQVKAAVLVLSLGISGLQIVSLIGGALLPERPDPLILSLVFCGLAPVVTVMACTGLLIGEERQTGSWAWSSSLPQSWQQALASKACITFGASLLTVVPLALAPAILWSLGYRLSFTELWEYAVVPAGVLLTMLELAMFLTVALLIFRDSLSGMMVGAIWITFVQIALLFAGRYYWDQWFDFQHNRETAKLSELVVLLALCAGYLLVGIAAVLWLYRWRWSHGLTAEFSLLRHAYARETTLPQVVRPLPVRTPAKGELWMLVNQSFRSCWAFYTEVVVVAVAIHWYYQISGVGTWTIALIASLLLGASTFSGDHNLGSYRFYADRGVTPAKFITARLAPSALLFTVAIVFVVADPNHYYLRSEDGALTTWRLCVCCVGAFLLSALGSLCFDKATFAIAASLMTGVAIALLAHWTAELSRYLDGVPDWYPWSIWAVVPVSLLLGLASLYRLSRKWVTQDAPGLPIQFAWLVPVLSLLPFALPLLYKFVFMPLLIGMR